MDNRALILGGAGFIGKRLAERLAVSGGVSVYVVDIILPDQAASMPELRYIKNYACASDWSISELCDYVRTLRPTTTIDLRSILIPSSGYRQYCAEILELLAPLGQLLDELASISSLYIYLSSGGAIYGDTDYLRIAEDAVRAPISHYGLSKLLMEEQIVYYARTVGLQHLILRPSNPYGPGQSFVKPQGLIAHAIHCALTNKVLSVYGDGSDVRDYIYIDDLVSYIIDLLASGVRNKIFNIGSGVGHSLNEVVRTIESVSGLIVRQEFYPRRATDPRRIVLDCSRLHQYVEQRQTPLGRGIRILLGGMHRA